MIWLVNSICVGDMDENKFTVPNKIFKCPVSHVILNIISRQHGMHSDSGDEAPALKAKEKCHFSQWPGIIYTYYANYSFAYKCPSHFSYIPL